MPTHIDMKNKCDHEIGKPLRKSCVDLGQICKHLLYFSRSVQRILKEQFDIKYRDSTVY